MPDLLPQFTLDRCPHCAVHKPHLSKVWGADNVMDHANQNGRNWIVYKCHTCGGLVTACSKHSNRKATDWYPSSETLDENLPSEVTRFLKQAKESLHSPDGAIMLTASAIDAMLKLKGLKKGFLNDRIGEAAKKHLITEDMAAWAHDVRLDANEPRHADEKAATPTIEDAKRVLNFAETLAEILFVLPERVKRGRQESAPAVVDNQG